MSTVPLLHSMPHRRRAAVGFARLAALSVVVAWLALGGGCSRGSATSGFSPTWTPSATVSASAAPTLSPEQAAARATALAMEPPDPYTPQFTPEGAITAATYFLNLYPYVYATGDIDAFEKMSDDNCEFCDSVINNATELHDAGGWIDLWEPDVTPLAWWTDQEDPNRYVVRAQVTSQERDQYPGDGQPPLHITRTEDILLVQLYWSGHNWAIEIVDLEEGGEVE
ncbi:DUF6318 family protein [Actinomyces qiguomingii]|uniref:DUF6318 family protein n=2 Tax=Actinomyces qiguomingii TaxID=2057800 RepID=UPI000FFE4696|nr:DUF6318 family protein [Actinomyces qiguomingii]